jgi:tRNA modification GTPase
MNTVVACSTPFGSSAIAVVRISGPKVKKVISLLQKKKKNFKHNTPFLSPLLDEDLSVFDEALINVFFGPNSYTGEDLAEISSHGNPIIIEKIISLSCLHGCKVAEPGEFTKRAYLNNKMDLSQAEAVSSLIASKSLAGTKLSYKNLGGGLADQIFSIKNSIILIIGEFEFNLDISEEDLQPNLIKNSIKKIHILEKNLGLALDGFKKTNLLTVGASVVIAGPTNAGKSTLFNRLLDEERAITSSIPGTTRDVLQDTINLRGVPIVLKDTAGIRKTKNVIEKIGMNKTSKQISSADVVIFLGKKPKKKGSNGRFIYVLNKIDLKKKFSGDYDIKISALKGKNIKKLTEIILELLSGQGKDSNIILTSKRQVENIAGARKFLKKSLLGLKEEKSLELVVEDLNSSLSFLDNITKKTTKDDILSSIFSSFCVGK